MLGELIPIIHSDMPWSAPGRPLVFGLLLGQAGSAVLEGAVPPSLPLTATPLLTVRIGHLPSQAAQKEDGGPLTEGRK